MSHSFELSLGNILLFILLVGILYIASRMIRSYSQVRMLYNLSHPFPVGHPHSRNDRYVRTERHGRSSSPLVGLTIVLLMAIIFIQFQTAPTPTSNITPPPSETPKQFNVPPRNIEPSPKSIPFVDREIFEPSIEDEQQELERVERQKERFTQRRDQLRKAIREQNME